MLRRKSAEADGSWRKLTEAKLGKAALGLDFKVKMGPGALAFGPPTPDVSYYQN